MRTTLETTALSLALAFAPAALAQDAAPAPRTVQEVMTTMTIPGSDAIFDGAADPPASAEKWTQIRRGAAMLAESGRLLTTDALAKDTENWIDMARALVTEADAAGRAADARDLSALESASDRVYTTCKACHDRYMPGAN